MSNLAFVTGAFAVTWAVIVGYLAHLRRIERDAREQSANMAAMPREGQ